MDIHDLIIRDREVVSLEDVFLDAESKKDIQQLIKEYKYVDELTKYNLPVNNKVLLQGSSGCGKTTTAKAIANALGKPILILLELERLPKTLNLFLTKLLEINLCFFWMNLIKLERREIPVIKMLVK